MKRNLTCEECGRFFDWEGDSDEFRHLLQELCEFCKKEDISCDTCETEMCEEGQQHFCGDCAEELTETQCKDWYGLCGRCAWRIKN